MDSKRSSSDYGEISDYGKEILDYDKEILNYEKEIPDYGEEIPDFGEEISDYGEDISDYGEDVSDYGEEIMPTLDQASLSKLTQRQQENFMKEHELAKKRFVARHSKNSQEVAATGEQNSDGLTKEAFSEGEANAILQHYYGAIDGQATGVRRQASVEGPYFGQDDSDSPVGAYGGIGLGGEDDEEGKTSPIGEQDTSPPSQPPMPPPKTASLRGRFRAWFKELFRSRGKDRH